MTKRRIVVLYGDTHAGSALALANPATKVTDPNTGEEAQLQINAPQQKLWQWYTEDIAAISKLAAGDPITLCHLGDPTQGTRFAQELASTAVSDHLLIALANLEPWFALGNLRDFFQVAGTGVHEFNEASASRIVAQLAARQWPAVRSKVLYHALLDIDGVIFDLAHHGPGPGSRRWLRGNVLRLYVRSLMQDDISAGHTPPHVVVRGHYHTYTSEVVTEGGHETRGIILPSWVWLNEHARKAAQSPSRISFGMVACEIASGELSGRPKPFLHTVDFRTREIIRDGDESHHKQTPGNAKKSAIRRN